MNLKIYEKTKYNNIYKHRKNGTYAVDLSLGYDNTGKRVRTTRTGILSEKEAKNIRDNELNKDKIKNIITNKSKFEDGLEEYYEWCLISKKIKPESLRKKKGRFDNNILPYFKGMQYEKIDEKEIIGWHKFIESKNFKPNTNNTLHKQLSAYFNWLVLRKKIMSSNPCLLVENFKIPRTMINYRTLDEMHTLWDAIENDNKKDVEIKLRILAFSKTLFFGGFRPGEFYGLQIQDFDFDILNNTEITVDQIGISIQRTLYYGKGGWEIGDGKTETSIGMIYIGKYAFQPLFNYIKYMQKIVDFKPDTYIMINPKTNKVFSQEYIRKELNYFLDCANLPHTKPKDMRSSHGTLLLSNGYSLEEVQSRLRHTKKQTTEKYYATFYNESKINLAKNIDKFAR